MKRFILTLLLLLTVLIYMPSGRISKPKGVAAAPRDARSERTDKSLDLAAIAVMMQ